MDNGDPRFPSSRFLRVACVIVPKGSPPPPEWLAAHPQYLRVSGYYTPPPSPAPNMGLGPQPGAEGQAEPSPEKPVFEVVIDYAGNWTIRPVAPLTPRPAPRTEPPHAPPTEEDPAQWQSAAARAHANFGVSERSGGSSHLFPGVQTVAAEDEDEPGDDELDPLAEERTQEFFSMQEQLAHIAPGSPYAASISKPDWVPSKQDVDEMIDALNTAIEEVASEIASGHASGGRIDYEFEALIINTIREPTESGLMANGRVWYYDKKQKFFVVINPGDPDGGSAYPVSDWPKYKKTLK
jgi:hypothetical protein